MKKKEIEYKLNKIISNSVPNCLDDILADCKKIKNLEKVDIMKKSKENQKRKIIPKFAVALATFVIILGGVFGYTRYNNVYKIDSIIDFDINPSVELRVNKNEKIIKVVPLNEDGKKVLDDMDLKRVDLDVAVNAIIGSMLKNGYITVDENSILVSVKNDDVKKANRLKEEITKEIDEILNASNIKGAILSQAYDDNSDVKVAESNDLSEGKTKLINKILESDIKDSKGNIYTFGALSKLSINELNVLLTTKNIEVKDINTTGTASESSYIGKEKAKEIAFNDANVKEKNVKNIKVEYDSDDGRFVYEIEFDITGAEYDYEIDAKTGDIIDKDVDKITKSTTTKTNTTKVTTQGTTNNGRYDDDDYYDDDDDYDDRYDD